MKTYLYVVGKWLSEASWELQGVYTTERAAIASALPENYFVGPVVANEPMPDETVVWPGCYYPTQYTAREDLKMLPYPAHKWLSGRAIAAGVVLLHKPSGVVAACAYHRDRRKNKDAALFQLVELVNRHEEAKNDQ